MIPNRREDSTSNVALESLRMYKNDFPGWDEIGMRIWKTLENQDNNKNFLY